MEEDHSRDRLPPSSILYPPFSFSALIVPDGIDTRDRIGLGGGGVVGGFADGDGQRREADRVAPDESAAAADRGDVFSGALAGLSFGERAGGGAYGVEVGLAGAYGVGADGGGGCV